MSAILGVQHRILARRTGTAENGLSPVSHVSGQEFSTPLSTGGTAQYLGNSAPTNPADLGYVSGRRVAVQVETRKKRVDSESVILVPQTAQYRTIYDTWNDYPQSPIQSARVLIDDPVTWYRFSDNGEDNRIIYIEPPPGPIPAIRFAPAKSFIQRIDVSDLVPGSLRFAMTGVDDQVQVVASDARSRDGTLLSGYYSRNFFAFPGTFVFSDWLRLDAQVASINILVGAAGVGFRLEFARDVPVVLED